MRLTLARLGDAMLARVLPTAEAAAACRVGAGTKCRCGPPCDASACTQYYYSCTLDCSIRSGHC